MTGHKAKKVKRKEEVLGVDDDGTARFLACKAFNQAVPLDGSL
jgi:hypothetical protein